MPYDGLIKLALSRSLCCLMTCPVITCCFSVSERNEAPIRRSFSLSSGDGGSSGMWSMSSDDFLPFPSRSALFGALFRGWPNEDRRGTLGMLPSFLSAGA